MRTTAVLNLIKPVRALIVRGRLLDDNLELIDAEAAAVRSRLAALEAAAGLSGAAGVTYDGAIVATD